MSVRSRKVLALRKPDGDKQGLEIRDLRSQNILGLVAKSFVSCLGLPFSQSRNKYEGLASVRVESFLCSDTWRQS